MQYFYHFRFPVSNRILANRPISTNAAELNRLTKPTIKKPCKTTKNCYNFLSLSPLRVLPSFSSSEHGHVVAASSSSASSSGAATGGVSRYYCKYPPSPVPRSRPDHRLNQFLSRSCEILDTPKFSPTTPRSEPRRKLNLLVPWSSSSQSTTDLRRIERHLHPAAAAERPEPPPSSAAPPNERANWWTELSTTLSKAGTMWHKVNRNWFRRTSTCPKQERYL